MDIRGRPHQLFRPDPVLGWSMTPNSTVEVPFRDGVVQHIGEDGWRTVPAQSDHGPRVNLYGCSWTFGTSLADTETLAAQLQSEFRSARFRSRGCGGYGTVHNYIQLRKDIAAEDLDIAVFLVISDHRFRNTPHPNRWKQLKQSRWKDHGITRVPITRQERDGRMAISYIEPFQPAVDVAGLDKFLPSDYMLDQATFATLQAANSLAEKGNIQTMIAVLDSVDMTFNTNLLARFGNAIDISVPFDEDHFFLPHDSHPNAQSNELFFERIRPQIASMLRTASNGCINQ